MGFVAVYTVGGEIQAELLRSVLEAGGIESFVQAAGVGGAYPVNVGDLGAARLFVRAQDRARAVELIEAALSGELGSQDG